MLTIATRAGLTFLLLSSPPLLAADLVPAPAAAEAEPCKATLIGPSFNGVIKANPSPTCFAAGPFGDLYIGGALTGYGYSQNNPFPRSFAPPGSSPERADRIDFSNLQGWIQKPEGTFQAYVQAGGYASPQLGFASYGSVTQSALLFTPLPVAFGRIQIDDTWSIQGGRMPALMGSEAPFTFQNLNINRGLLFIQSNIISQGAQVNYSSGPLAVSVAGTDGFFAGEVTWFVGSVAYKLDDASTLGINGGLNLGKQNAFARGPSYQFATAGFQQNSGVLNLTYTYAAGPWIITPYFQFTNVDRDLRAGIATSASSYAGSVLAAYAFTDTFALAGRVEYEEQTGVRGSGTTGLLFGPGSTAFSVTVTPTFTFGRTVFRLEYAHVELGNITRGSLAAGTLGTGFGRTGNRTSQDRFMIETGIVF